MTKLTESQREERAQAKIELAQAKTNYSRLIRLGFSSGEAKSLVIRKLPNGVVVKQDNLGLFRKPERDANGRIRTKPNGKPLLSKSTPITRMVGSRARAAQRAAKEGVSRRKFLKTKAVGDIWNLIHKAEAGRYNYLKRKYDKNPNSLSDDEKEEWEYIRKSHHPKKETTPAQIKKTLDKQAQQDNARASSFRRADGVIEYFNAAGRRVK